MRRQPLIKAISEGDRTPIMAANTFFVPNTEEFFEGLDALLQQCGLCREENSDDGLAEFLGRRIEEYQLTFRGMYGRVRESAAFQETTHSRYGIYDPSNWYTIGIPGSTVQ